MFVHVRIPNVDPTCMSYLFIACLSMLENTYIGDPTCISYLGRVQDIDPIEDYVVHASPEIFLVAQKYFVEGAHAADEHAEVNVELVEAAGKVNPEINIIITMCF